MIINNVKESCIRVIYFVLYPFNLSIFLNIYDLLVDTNGVPYLFSPEKGKV
jgi:hypothetical protein